MDKGLAPAKINLALHVTGQRADGYHLLDSIVVFADLGDRIAAQPADRLSLTVDGPFAAGVPLDDSNLVLRAARALQAARGVTRGAALRLTKALPHAAGIGSGSSDAAATIRLLADLWGVAPLAPDDPAAVALGADVPVCLHAPHPVRMQGVGEVLTPLHGLPAMGMVLVNPRVEVPTPAVFRALVRKRNAPLPDNPAPRGALSDWLAGLRNDLQGPAETLAPEITRALAALRRLPTVLGAVMSGSGATCVGITRTLGDARVAARTMQVAEMGWWVAPAAMLTAPVQTMRATT